MTRHSRGALIILLSAMLPSMPSAVASGDPAAPLTATDVPESNSPESNYECHCNVRKRQQVEARLAKKAGSASQQTGDVDAGQPSQSTETSPVSRSD
jgi:hypothetical protein